MAASADNHDINEDDIRHAPRNLIAVADDPHDDDVTPFVGPNRATVNLIEVGGLDTDDGPSSFTQWPPAAAQANRRRSDHGSNHR